MPPPIELTAKTQYEMRYLSILHQVSRLIVVIIRIAGSAVHFFNPFAFVLPTHKNVYSVKYSQWSYLAL